MPGKRVRKGFLGAVSSVHIYSSSGTKTSLDAVAPLISQSTIYCNKK